MLSNFQWYRKLRGGVWLCLPHGHFKAPNPQCEAHWAKFTAIPVEDHRHKPKSSPK